MKRVFNFKKGEDYFYMEDIERIVEDYIIECKPEDGYWPTIKEDCKVEIVIKKYRRKKGGE